MKIYHTFYTTKRFVVSVTRDNTTVDILVYKKSEENWETVGEGTYINTSDLEALKSVREMYNI